MAIVTAKPYVVFVGPKNPLNENLVHSLDAAGLPTVISTREEASDLILGGQVVAVLIRSATDRAAHGFFNENMAGKVRTMPYILISTQDLNISSTEVFERGFSAHLREPVNNTQLAETLRSSISAQHEREIRRHERKDISHRVQWHASDSTDLCPGVITNVSEGGMFIQTEDTLPTQGQPLVFELYIDDNPAWLIQGIGLVRWQRKDPSNLESPNMVNGFGIEFTALTRNSITVIRQLMSDKRGR